MWTLQRHLDRIQKTFQITSPWAKSFSLWTVGLMPRGKTHSKKLNSSSKHVSLDSKGNAMRCVVVPLWLWFVPQNGDTVMTCQGQPFCSQTLTEAFQRQRFIPESTDHSEIMLVVSSQVGNMQSLCLEKQQFWWKFTSKYKELFSTITLWFIVLCIY